MLFRTTVLYPNSEGAEFDMSYYLATHVPLVLKCWGPYGLQAWEVVEYKPSADGITPPFIASATMLWESPDQLQTALASEDAKAVFADRPNFTNTTPIFTSGAVLASSSTQ
jgi:uncharacterized protein (TIGR02118 family)